MVPICADALECQILVYEKADGDNDLRITRYNCTPFGKELHMKFSSDHYDSIIMQQPTNLDMLSTVCSSTIYEEEHQALDLTVKGYINDNNTTSSLPNLPGVSIQSSPERTEEMYSFDSLDVGGTVELSEEENVSTQDPANEEILDYSIEQITAADITVNDTQGSQMSPNIGRGHVSCTEIWSQNLSPRFPH